MVWYNCTHILSSGDPHIISLFILELPLFCLVVSTLEQVYHFIYIFQWDSICTTYTPPTYIFTFKIYEINLHIIQHLDSDQPSTSDP